MIAWVAMPAYAEGGTVCVVRRCDTLYGIARQNNVSVTALAQANSLTSHSWAYVGQRLVIPGTQQGTVTIVRRGDTLGSLARRICKTVVAIQRANGPSDSRIRVGQRLVILGGCGATSKNVEGWSGVVIKLPPGNQFGQYFLRDDGQRYDIGSSSTAIGTPIADAC